MYDKLRFSSLAMCPFSVFSKRDYWVKAEIKSIWPFEKKKQKISLIILNLDSAQLKEERWRTIACTFLAMFIVQKTEN